MAWNRIKCVFFLPRDPSRPPLVVLLGCNIGCNTGWRATQFDSLGNRQTGSTHPQLAAFDPQTCISGKHQSVTIPWSCKACHRLIFRSNPLSVVMRCREATMVLRQTSDQHSWAKCFPRLSPKHKTRVSSISFCVCMKVNVD